MKPQSRSDIGLPVSKCNKLCRMIYPRMVPAVVFVDNQCCCLFPVAGSCVTSVHVMKFCSGNMLSNFLFFLMQYAAFV